MNVLVLGANGAVGQNVIVELLKANHGAIQWFKALLRIGKI